MLDSTGERRAALTMAGGVLCSCGLALDDVAPDYVGLAVLVPALLGFGVVEIYRRYGGRYGSIGRAGALLTGVGLGFLLVAILLFAVVPPGLVAVVLVAVPGTAGLVALSVGSALLATSLYRLGVVSAPTAALLGLGVPLTPLVGALLAALAGPGTLLGSIAPAGLVPGLSGTPYGVGWFVTGHRLWQTVDAPHEVEDRTVAVEVSPQLVSAALVGSVFGLLGASRFLPLGPLSGTPWVGRSLWLDVGHLLVGTVGLGVAVLCDVRAARRYNRAVGLASLVVVVLTFVGVFQDVHALRWLVAARLDLNVPDVILYLPASVLLLVVGFGLGESSTAEGSTASE